MYGSTDWPSAPPMSALVNRVHCCDALELLRMLPDASVDAVITDPPYGQTNIVWDKTIDLKTFWFEVKRVVKPESAIVMTAMQPFASHLIMSNLEMFRYEWIMVKSMATDFLNANHRPLRAHENILVFSQGKTVAGSNGGEMFMSYYPQFSEGNPYIKKKSGVYEGYRVRVRTETENDGYRYPRTVIYTSNGNSGSLHPTQKPLDIIEYLVQTYTKSGDLVVDPFSGSGTTALAARRTGRNFITGDISPEYAAIARERLRLPFDEHHVEPPKELPKDVEIEGVGTQYSMFKAVS